MKKYFSAAGIVAMLLLAVWLGTGCKSTTSDVPLYGPSQILEAPSYVAANQDSFYLFRFQTDPEESFDSVECNLLSASNTLLASFAFFDDGGYDSLWGPANASVSSGDVVPHNGVFTRRANIRGMIQSQSGVYTINLIPMKGGTSVSGYTQTLHVEDVESSRIISYPQDSVFAECFTPIPMTVHVSRSDADLVSAVQVELFENNTADPVVLADFQSSSGDTVWQLNFSPTDFGCTQTDLTGALYHLIFRVQTRFGMGTEQAVNVHSFVNSRPTISNSVLPDTLYRPAAASDTNRIIMTVRLHDCEYLATRDFDSYSIHYDVSRDDTLNWGSSPSFVLFDNQFAPDGRPFDGTWAGGLSVTKHPTLLNNMYYFRFYAIDCALPHDTSAYLLDSVRVIQATALRAFSSSTVAADSRFAVLP